MTPEAMARIHAACFPHAPWTAATLQSFTKRPGTIVLTDPQHRGFLIAQALAPEAEILTLAVAPEARRQGIAKRLLTQLQDSAQTAGVAQIFLEVAADNPAACALYTASGYAQIGTRNGYYSRSGGPNADALIMSLRLT